MKRSSFLSPITHHLSLIFLMNSTRVLLIRHGQSEGNAEGRFGGHTATPLSVRGRLQSEATAHALLAAAEAHDVGHVRGAGAVEEEFVLFDDDLAELM